MLNKKPLLVLPDTVASYVMCVKCERNKGLVVGWMDLLCYLPLMEWNDGDGSVRYRLDGQVGRED